MAKKIISIYKEGLQKNDWLLEETKAQAIKKTRCYELTHWLP